MVQRPEPGPIPVADALACYRHATGHWDAAFRREGTVPTEVVELVLSCAVLVLRSYGLPENWPNGLDHTPREHLPADFVKFFADQFAYILAGQLPDPIRQLTGRGVPGAGPEEDRAIGLAVAYIGLAKAGVIDDRHPVTTIRNLYNVTDSTVRKWRRNRSHIEPSDFYPDADAEERSVLISDAVQRWGQRYSAAGHNRIQRTHKAKKG